MPDNKAFLQLVCTCFTYNLYQLWNTAQQSECEYKNVAFHILVIKPSVEHMLPPRLERCICAFHYTGI